MWRSCHTSELFFLLFFFIINYFWLTVYLLEMLLCHWLALLACLKCLSSAAGCPAAETLCLRRDSGTDIIVVAAQLRSPRRCPSFVATVLICCTSSLHALHHHLHFNGRSWFWSKRCFDVVCFWSGLFSLFFLLCVLGFFFSYFRGHVAHCRLSEEGVEIWLCLLFHTPVSAAAATQIINVGAERIINLFIFFVMVALSFLFVDMGRPSNSCVAMRRAVIGCVHTPPVDCRSRPVTLPSPPASPRRPAHASPLPSWVGGHTHHSSRCLADGVPTDLFGFFDVFFLLKSFQPNFSSSDQLDRRAQQQPDQSGRPLWSLWRRPTEELMHVAGWEESNHEQVGLLPGWLRGR